MVDARGNAARGPHFWRAERNYLLLVLLVVVEAETPEEPAEAFDSQALRALRAAAVRANRVKNLMVFIITLYSPPFSRWSQFEQTFGHESKVGNENR